MTDSTTIDIRLDALPRKTSAAFRDLLDRGFITQGILETILDAADVAEDTSKLLGFAIGYVNLRQSGVPMTDVIKMSRNLGRKIRLDWSINRWRKEHDRLSRAEALARLAKENVDYDVSAYEAHLPERFPGYLIRNSRRLGMEGLRQRHCVASYHSQLSRGSCALASVFVNHHRWTVQLNLTKDSEAPLAVTQLRTRFNQLPGPAVTAAVSSMLGIKKPVQESLGSLYARRPRADRTYLRNLQRLLPILRHHQLGNVTVTFDGYGDSGSIDCILFDRDDIDPTSITVDFDVSSTQLENGEWIKTVETQRTDLRHAIEDLVYDYLEETGVDWVNNDGGYGEFRIDVDIGSAYMEVNGRFTETNCEYRSEFDIQTGDEL